jgi:hypothetical protein
LAVATVMGEKSPEEHGAACCGMLQFDSDEVCGGGRFLRICVWL